MRAVRVLFADDHPLVREGLRRLLSTLPDVEVVGEAVDGVDALSKVKSLRPDVLLIDLAMPRMGGLETIRLAREASAETQVIVVSMLSAESFVHRALQAGALGYVVKGENTDELLAALRAVRSGRHYLSASIDPAVMRLHARNSDLPAAESELDRLSGREVQVFQLLVGGNTTARIAEMLFISPKTVEKHRASIAQKLGIASQTDLIKIAIRTGLLDAEFWKR